MRPEAGSALVWPIKSGFVTYVEAVPDGAVSLVGAEVHDGNFIFPAAEATDAASADTALEGTLETRPPLRFRGSAIFRAYRGVLAVRIRNPWIEREAGGGSVTIEHPEIRESTGLGTAAGLRCAIATYSGDPELGPVIPQLTFEGARMFGDTYPVGMALDPLRVREHAPTR